MDRNGIIQKGDTTKFQVIISREDFMPSRDDFYVVLRWGIPQQSLTIKKDEMVHDEEFNYFIVFETANMIGRLEAECHYLVPDTDIEAGDVRENIDRQYIGFVVDNGCPKFACRKMCFGNDGGFVQYRRIFRADANSLYVNLRYADGQLVMSEDNKIMKARKDNLN